MKAECWSKDVSEALNSLVCGESIASGISGGLGEPQLKVMDASKVLAALNSIVRKVWTRVGDCDPRADALPNDCRRKVVVYDRWMSVPWEGMGKPPLPQYLSSSVPTDVWRDLSRFRTSSHRLRVETGRWEGLERRMRVCDLCGAGDIQDEKHVAIECPAIESVRTKYAELLNSCGGDMKNLMLSQSDHLAWFLHDRLRAIDDFNRVIPVDTTEDDAEDGEQPL